ncbi:hypothetical protein ON010_g6444 [Phytophthora cinnamomi]|nr:hypothetical protein ON010_g6444 [Phytophthora cinnamomi]
MAAVFSLPLNYAGGRREAHAPEHDAHAQGLRQERAPAAGRGRQRLRGQQHPAARRAEGHRGAQPQPVGQAAVAGRALDRPGGLARGRRVRRQAAGRGRAGRHGFVAVAAAVAVSTVGAFGSNEFMEKLCGDATIAAARAAQKAGVERFVFVSNSRVGSYYPSWLPMHGYYNGKERAEAAVQARFPETGVALRPGFIYGWRRTKKGQGIPLQLIGAPISMLARDLGAVSTGIGYMPFFGEEMKAAIPVGAVAKAAVLSAIGPVHGQTLDTTSMLEIAASFHIHE